VKAFAEILKAIWRSYWHICVVIIFKPNANMMNNKKTISLALQMIDFRQIGAYRNTLQLAEALDLIIIKTDWSNNWKRIFSHPDHSTFKKPK